jgi:hypothetical protein
VKARLLLESSRVYSAHARKHARVRDAAATTSFATPGVYWNNPQPARWAVPVSDAKYEFLVYVREITDYVDTKFKALRDEVNDLPATLSSVTKQLGKPPGPPPPPPPHHPRRHPPSSSPLSPLLNRCFSGIFEFISLVQVPAALKDGNSFTLWSACGLAMSQNARAVPVDGNISRTDGA